MTGPKPRTVIPESPNVAAALRAEVWVGRLWVALIVFALVAGLIGSAVVMHIRSLHQEISTLERSRVMFGFPNEQGVFVSSNKRPEYMVVRFAREYVNNLYNTDEFSVEENFRQVAKMMDPSIALGEGAQLARIAQEVRSSKASQSFARYKEMPLIEDDESYTYICEGRISGHLGSTITRNNIVKITVRLKKVTPTTARAEGLVVARMDEQVLK